MPCGTSSSLFRFDVHEYVSNHKARQRKAFQSLRSFISISLLNYRLIPKPPALVVDFLHMYAVHFLTTTTEVGGNFLSLSKAPTILILQGTKHSR